MAGVRAFCRAIDWRRTPELAMSVRKVATGQGLQDADAAEWVQ